MNPVRIAPSILNADHSQLTHEIERVAAASDLIHLDIMDNIFVPNQTFTFEQGSQIIADSILPVDTHLMVVEPEIWGEKYAQAGSTSVTFHLEATHKIGEAINRIHDAGAQVGIAIKPGTPWNSVLPWIDDVEMVLIMTVEPGFGGQSFIPEMMEKVSQLRAELDQRHLEAVSIEVDGGISLDTISIARTAGADTFVAGSAVYRNPNPHNMVISLRDLIQNI
jgi:ribulose-phosphate 3-epimerase